MESIGQIGEIRLARTFAVVNQKGGVGKTTTVINLGAYLALRGLRVLVVDCDPQGNASSGLGIERASSRNRPLLYDCIINETPALDAVVQTATPGLSILPSNIDLAGAEPELTVRIAREYALKRVLEPIMESYDFILLDAPPSLGILTVNVLTAAHEIIVPIQCEYFALEGVTQLTRTVELVRRNLNPTLRIAMVVMTMYDPRARSTKQIVDEVRKVFGTKVAETIIPRNVRLAEAPSHGQPVSTYDPRSRGAAAYRALAQEVANLG